MLTRSRAYSTTYAVVRAERAHHMGPRQHGRPLRFDHQSPLALRRLRTHPPARGSSRSESPNTSQSLDGSPLRGSNTRGSGADSRAFET
ncbi:hypothetical protein ACWCPI_18720 [Streptomyces sp. NPDC001920]